MYYVYVLRNHKTHELYYGYIDNLKRRFVQHNQNGSRELIYYEAYKSEADARRREKRLKDYGQAISALKSRLKESLR